LLDSGAWCWKRRLAGAPDSFAKASGSTCREVAAKAKAGNTASLREVARVVILSADQCKLLVQSVHEGAAHVASIPLVPHRLNST
jgi:hypothetical protein